jgi:hypothetical protein
MISLILIALAGALNATYEILFTGFNKSIFRNLNPEFWNPNESWIYKWDTPIKEYSESKWYYFGYAPRYKERFPYSSTVFVFLTDAWHLFKSLMLGCIMISVVNYSVIVNPFIDFILIYVTFTFTFTIFFDYVLRIRKKVK